MIRPLLIGLAVGASSMACAASPQAVLDALTRDAGASASAARGETLFRAKVNAGGIADSCTSCHTENPKARGQHVKTHKEIEPIAPIANKERFTDPAKVEKWFKRNCKEVLGRPCTAQEKADFTAYMIGVK